MEAKGDRTSAARALFKRFLAERWFGGPDFESWVAKQAELGAELRALRDEWLAELGDPESLGHVPASERGARRAASFAAGEVIGGFRLKSRLGSGASSEVWEAEELALGNRRVALKLLRPDLVPDPRALERFRREGLACSRINHPGVITVYSVGWSQGQPFIAQELIEGGLTLAALIARQRELGRPDAAYVRRVAELVAQAAEGLAATHAAGLVHRDVKPQNILVTRNDRAKVADFGLAHLAGEHPLSQTGDVMGTCCYMSPAQARGEVRELDGGTDVFSLGATLYELLTLRRAFPGNTLQAITLQILQEDPPSARTLEARVPAQLELLCAKALEKRPVDRLPNMTVFAEELRRYLRGEPSLLHGTTLAGRALKWTRRHPTTSAVAAVALAAIAAGSWWSAAKAGEQTRSDRETLYAKALYAIEMDDMAEATQWIARADALAGADPTGHLILATGYARGGRRPEIDAELALAKARGFSAEPEQLESAFEHAGYALFLQSKHDLNRYPEIARHLETALALNPKLYALEFVRYQVCEGLGDSAGAASALQRLRNQLRPSEPLSVLLEALVQEKNGDPAAAMATLERLRTSVSADELRALRWNRHAGRIAVSLADYPRAQELLQQALVESPGDCSSWETLSKLCLKQLHAGERSAAFRATCLANAAKALDCSATLEAPYLLQAYVAELEISRELDAGSLGGEPTRSAHWQPALEALTKVQELHPGGSKEARRLESHLRYLEGGSFYARRDYVAAGERYERALELDPDNVRALSLLGQCAYWQKDFQRGLSTLERGMTVWDDPAREADRDPKWLGVLLSWMLTNAAELGDEPAFGRAKTRLRTELGAGTKFEVAELLTAAEALATAPKTLCDCDLALELVDEYRLDTAFDGGPNEHEAHDVLGKIRKACAH